MKNTQQRRAYFAKHPFHRFLVMFIAAAIGFGVKVLLERML